MNTTTFSIWCYVCDNDINDSAAKRLHDISQFIKKEVQKQRSAEESMNDIQNKIAATMTTTITPLLNDVKDNADESMKSEAVEHTTSVTFTLPSKRMQRNSLDTIKSSDLLPRVTGLSNLGNTCFFNAVTQNLAQTPFLLENLKETQESGEQFELPGGKMKLKPEGKDEEEEIVLDQIKSELETASDSTVTSALTKTLDQLQNTSGGVFTPSDLLKQFTKKWPQFAGGDQHDSHEALRHLLESVRNEELRRFQQVILKDLGFGNNTDPSKVSPDNKAKIKFYGFQAQERILRPDPVFRGYLVSTLTCQDCFNVSPRQEFFLDLSLPVTVDKPQPPARRKSSPEPSTSSDMKISSGPKGPSKAQLKKEKRLEHKSKRAQKNQNRRRQSKDVDRQTSLEPPASSSSTAAENDEKPNESSSSSLSESDADVEDNVTDDPQSRRDDNGNELKSPQTPEKRDDMPENPSKNDEEKADNVVVEGTLSATGMVNALSTHISKMNVEGEAAAAAIAADTESVVKKQQRKRLISHADWNNTLAPRLQCADGELSVQSCLNNFTSVELMTGNNKVGCEACTERINGKKGKTVYTNATKQFLISSPPTVLILHLKRFQMGGTGFRGMGFRKITKHVTFPLILDIAPFCASNIKFLPNVRRHQKKLLYSLYGIVEHSGGMHGELIYA